MAKILLVEDNDLIRNGLMQLLQKTGYDVKSATNGEEATTLLTKTTFDIMITDLIMPKKNGITLISEVKHKYPAMEIISISDGGQLDAVDYLDLSESIGASVSFEKPIDQSAFLMAIQLLLHAKKNVKLNSLIPN